MSWKNISNNPNINFNSDFLRQYSDKIIWDQLSNNKGDFWTLSLLNEFKNKFDWSGHRPYCNNMDADDQSLSTNEYLPWSENLIDRFSDRLNFDSLSLNRAIPWSENLIDKYYDKWDWGFLSSNISIPWSKDLIIKYEDKLDFTLLCGNPALPWSISLLLFFIEIKDKWKLKPNYMWNWHYVNKGILYNENIPWDDGLKEYLVNRYPEEVDELVLYELDYYEWNINTLKKCPINKFNYYFFQNNDSIMWNEEMIIFLAVNSHQGWPLVSRIKNLSLELIEKFANKLDWDKISQNNSNIGKFDFLEKYESKINFRKLSNNKNLKWDINYLSKYKNDYSKLHWGDINFSHNLPFSVKFIHDFSDKLYRLNLPTWNTVKDYIDDDLILRILK